MSRRVVMAALALTVPLLLIVGCSSSNRMPSQQRAQQQFDSNRDRYDAAARSLMTTALPAVDGDWVDLPVEYADLAPQGGVKVRDVEGQRIVVFNLADYDPDYYVGYLYAPGFDRIPAAVLGEGGSARKIDGDWWSGHIR